MTDELICEDYVGKRVMAIHTDKSMYLKNKIIGECGTVARQSGIHLGVLMDRGLNEMSGYGVYWFDTNEVEILESENVNMNTFEYIAVVNLVDDYSKKDYSFALYKEDYDLINSNHPNTLVVVNAKGKDNRVLGILKEVKTVEEYFAINENKGRNITAEIVGIVNMNRYIAREEEEIRLKELAKRKAAIEMELEKEINKRKSVEYYEEMARKYSDNPKLAELVAELRGLGT